MAERHPFWDQLEGWKADAKARNLRRSPAELGEDTLRARKKLEAVLAELEAKP